MWLRPIFAAVQLAIAPPATSAQESRASDDPLFRNQLSYYHGGGAAQQPRAVSTHRVDTVGVSGGVTLDMPDAWALTTGNSSVVVAVLDDGFFYWHEDLAPNVWRNTGESGLDEGDRDRETNGQDDDGNGYIDDVMGWDFAFDDADPDRQPPCWRGRERVPCRAARNLATSSIAE